MVLICLYRESLKGWLKTMRFVNQSIEHGTEPTIFWVCDNRQGPGQKKVGLLRCERDGISPLRNLSVISCPRE